MEYYKATKDEESLQIKISNLLWQREKYAFNLVCDLACKAVQPKNFVLEVVMQNYAYLKKSSDTFDRKVAQRMFDLYVYLADNRKQEA